MRWRVVWDAKKRSAVMGTWKIINTFSIREGEGGW